MADALSRQFLNNISEIESIPDAVHSEVSSSNTIKSITFPVNQFRIQIFITKGNSNSKRIKICFQKYIRHVIEYSDVENLYSYLQPSVNSKVVNAICCDLPTLAKIQNHILETFPSIKFGNRFNQSK